MNKPSLRALLLILSLAVSVTAQTPQRIKFAKGRNSVVVKGTTGSNGVTYLLRANSGQKLILKLNPSSGAGIKVETDGSFGHQVLLDEEKGGTYQVGLEESGDCAIFIGSTNGKSVSFTLTIRIARMTDI